jgi:hypothetical protein
MTSDATGLGIMNLKCNFSSNLCSQFRRNEDVVKVDAYECAQY